MRHVRCGCAVGPSAGTPSAAAATGGWPGCQQDAWLPPIVSAANCTYNQPGDVCAPGEHAALLDGPAGLAARMPVQACLCELGLILGPVLCLDSEHLGSPAAALPVICWTPAPFPRRL